MGMFDYVRCEYPLPEGAPTTGYQTKDTPEPLYLNHYVITRDGRLTLEGEDMEFHGDLNFYTSNVSGTCGHGYMTDDGKPYAAWDFVALFNHGQLIDLSGGQEAPDEFFAKPPLTREEFWRDPPTPTGVQADAAHRGTE